MIGRTLGHYEIVEKLAALAVLRELKDRWRDRKAGLP